MDINEVLREAVSRHASDLHLTVEAPPAFRVFGEVTRAESPALAPSDTSEAFEAMATPADATAFGAHGQVSFSYSVAGVGRFRVNAFKQRGSVAISVRILWPKVPTLGELSLPLVVAELSMKPNGMVLVTGAAGSGKSSTLAGLVDLVNESRSAHVITVEDPIEYLHKHGQSIVNQREVGGDTRSFADGLRAALREDPDVIMVGDLRDVEAIRLSLAAAETGHLVLGAMYAANAHLAVSRIVEVFPPHEQQQVKVQLAAVLTGVVAQQLIPRIDKPGRAAACEVLVGTPTVRNLIREGRVHQIHSAIQTGAKYGMRTMEQSLRDLYEKHIISMEEYMARSGPGAERDLPV